MSTRFPWLRLYDDTLTDRKLQRIAAMTGDTWRGAVGFWCGLLLLANERSNCRGRVMLTDDIPMTDAEIADALQTEPETAAAMLDAMEACGMIERNGVTTILNWDKRQRMSDSGAERVRRHRARKKEEERKNKKEEDIYISNALQKRTVTQHVTLQNVTQPLHDVTTTLQDDAYHDMHAAIAGTVKETYADFINGEAYDAATRAMLDAQITVEQVTAFREWWRDNGHYDGRPALKSLVQHIKASVDGAEPAPVDEDMFQL